MPHRGTPVKPPYGSPCNRCGLCCMNELCPLAASLFRRTDGPCPALLSVGDGYSCGLVLSPERFAPMLAFAEGKDRLSAAAAALIGAGHGCDAQTPGEQDNPRPEVEAIPLRLII